MPFDSVEHTRTSLEAAGYICTREIATVIFLAASTTKPVLVEGPAGVGKTELAKAVSRSLNREMIRLQCYEGLDEAKALYEWEYAKQLLYTQVVKEKIADVIGAAASLADAVQRIADQEDAFFPSASCCTVPCCVQSSPIHRQYFWWTRWTSPIRNSRPSFLKYSAITRSPFPNWARSGQFMSPSSC